jgi:hypothetical protein
MLSKSCKRKLAVCCNFKKKVWYRESLSETIVSVALARRLQVPPLWSSGSLFSQSAPLISVQILRLAGFIYRRHRVSQGQNPFNQMILADLADGMPEKRHLHAVDATDVGDQDL